MKLFKKLSILSLLISNMIFFSGCYTTFSSMQKDAQEEEYYSVSNDNYQHSNNTEETYYTDPENPDTVYEVYADSSGQEYLVEVPQEPAYVTNKYYNVDFYEYDPWDRPFHNSVYIGYPFTGDIGYVFTFSTYYWDDPWYWNYGPYWRHYYPYWYYPMVYDYYYPHYWHDHYYGHYWYDGHRPRNQKKRDWDKRSTARRADNSRSGVQRNNPDQSLGGTAVIGGSSGVRSASKTAIQSNSVKTERKERTTVRKDRNSSSGKRKIIRRSGSRKTVDKDRSRPARSYKTVKPQRTENRRYTKPSAPSSGKTKSKAIKPSRRSSNNDKKSTSTRSKRSSSSSKKNYRSSSSSSSSSSGSSVRSRSSSSSRSSSVRSNSGRSSSRSSSSSSRSSSKRSSGGRGKKR